jgi:hypothetical protein
MWTVIGYSNENMKKEYCWSRGILGAIYFLYHGHIYIHTYIYTYRVILEGKFSIVWGDSIGHCGKRKCILTSDKYWMVNEIELFESDLCTGVRKCTEAGGGIVKNLLWTETNL